MEYKLTTIPLAEPYTDTNYNIAIQTPNTWSGVFVHSKNVASFVMCRQCINNDSAVLRFGYIAWTN